MTEVFSTLMTMMTIITMGGDNLPNETNSPSAPSRSYYFIWMGNCGVKEDGPRWDRLNAGRTSGRVLFLRSSSVRRSLKQKPIRKRERAGLPPRVIISKLYGYPSQRPAMAESCPYSLLIITRGV